METTSLQLVVLIFVRVMILTILPHNEQLTKTADTWMNNVQAYQSHVMSVSCETVAVWLYETPVTVS